VQVCNLDQHLPVLPLVLPPANKWLRAVTAFSRPSMMVRRGEVRLTSGSVVRVGHGLVHGLTADVLEDDVDAVARRDGQSPPPAR
jgi:hypothetical protein